MIHIPGLSNAMAYALIDIAANHQPRTASARALVRKGLAAEVAPKLFALTETGKVAWRCLQARNNLSTDFVPGMTAERVMWSISRDKLVYSIAPAKVRKPTGVRGIEIEVQQTWGLQLTTVEASDLLMVAQEAAPQPAQEHPAVAALRGMDIDAMDPITALVKLYELKRMAGQA